MPADLTQARSAAIAAELLRRVAYRTGLKERPRPAVMARGPCLPSAAASPEARIVTSGSTMAHVANGSAAAPALTAEAAPAATAVPAAAASSPPPAADKTADSGIYTPEYDYDGLRNDPTIIHNHDFMREPRFVRAFEAGSEALGHDHKMFWRLHVALWAAQQAARLPGDFVECGVWRGFLSTAIVTYLDWESLGKTFFLFDTFEGLDPDLLTDAEKANASKVEHLNTYFRDTFPFVSEHFKKFPRVRLIKGPVPSTLTEVEIGEVSFMSIDMNCVLPELAAAEFFWPKLVSGGIVVLDDYGFVSYEEQKRGFDTFAARHGVEVLALPTGQGLIVKP